MTLDPFTPWQEDPKALAARTVGPDAPQRWLLAACEEFLAGKRPTWCLVVGPRGSGKSHLLQLVRARISQDDAVTWIGEDTATLADADALWARIWRAEDPWGWVPAAVEAPRRILFVEGLDRLLGGLRPEGRWTFRHHLQESGAFLVGTAISAALAGQEGEAFFGQLDTWILEPLGVDDARALFVRVSGEEDRAPSPASLTRREALVGMAGGSPRAVVTLAEAVRGTEAGTLGAAEGLLRAVQRLVTHYQQRFHDLPPLGQQILETLARAPRELTAGEVQRFTGATTPAISASARLLEAAGALRRSADPDDARVSRYALAEPLFRYWLEYRSTPSWSATRAAWLGRLLGEVLTREELTDVWWQAPEGEIRDAVATQGDASPLIQRALIVFFRASGPEEQDEALHRALSLRCKGRKAQLWVFVLRLRERPDLL